MSQLVSQCWSLLMGHYRIHTANHSPDNNDSHFLAGGSLERGLFVWLRLVIAPGGYSLCDGWYICAAVLTPFFHFGRIEHDLFGVFFSPTNSKAIFWGTKTTNFYKNRSFWPQIQFFPRSFWVQFSAASGTPPSVFRPSTPPPPGVIAVG